MKGGLLGLPGLTAATIAPERLRPLLAEVTTLRGLIDLGVERGFTVWPEWGPTFTHLDKRIENRPNPPPAGLVGQRIAFHNGAHVGGRKGGTAGLEGIRAMLRTAESAGWRFTGNPPSRGERGRRGVDRRSYNDVNFGRGILVKGDVAVDFDGIRIVTSAITFTAVIAGFEPPTDSPKYPWQFASDPEDSESWSYGWHVTDVVVLRAPIPCAGLQGPWTLAGAIEREAKRKAKAAR